MATINRQTSVTLCQTHVRLLLYVCMYVIYTTAYALYDMNLLCVIKHHSTCLIRSHSTLQAHSSQQCTVQLNLNFTHVCRHTHVLACLTRAKLKKLACACTVAHDFSVCMRDSTWFATLHM